MTPFGRRISKTTGSTTTTYFLYSDTGLMAETDSQGQLIKAYGFNPKAAQQGLWSTDPIWQADVAANSLTSTTTIYHYMHTDHLSTPMLATDRTGYTTWKGTSEAFGATNPTILATQMNLRFPGQYWDQETSTHYNFHRDYVPGIGRYVQSDPIGLNGGINEFAYVEGNPLMRKDAYGLFSSGADFALVRHFYGGTGNYMDISDWCGDYVSDAQVEGVIESIKKILKFKTKN